MTATWASAGLPLGAAAPAPEARRRGRPPAVRTPLGPPGHRTFIPPTRLTGTPVPPASPTPAGPPGLRVRFLAGCGSAGAARAVPRAPEGVGGGVAPEVSPPPWTLGPAGPARLAVRRLAGSRSRRPPPAPAGCRRGGPFRPPGSAPGSRSVYRGLSRLPSVCRGLSRLPSVCRGLSRLPSAHRGLSRLPSAHRGPSRPRPPPAPTSPRPDNPRRSVPYRPGRAATPGGAPHAS